MDFFFLTQVSFFDGPASCFSFRFFLGGLHFGPATLKFQLGLLKRLFFRAQIVFSSDV
jgi:hypothetical protein